MKQETIVIDCERCRTKPSGLQHYCEFLVEGVSTLRSDFAVYGPYSIAGARLVPYRPYHKVLNLSLREFELFHITHQASKISQRGLFPKRILLTVHDLNYLHLSGTKGSTLRRFIRRVRHNISAADHIVCISNFVREDLLAHAHLFPQVREKPISVIYNGLHFPQEDFERALPSELQGRRYLLNIGQAMPKKNQLSIVRALPFLPHDLVCIVDSLTSPYTLLMKQTAEQIGVSNRLLLYTRVTDATKQAILSHAEAMVHPSLAEGFGYTPVEQMYHRRPVFLSSLCSLPEVGGDAAFYFDSLAPEAMAATITEGLDLFEADKERLSKRLRQRALDFTQEKMARNYHRLYDSLLHS